jgi:hypothetical protein
MALIHRPRRDVPTPPPAAKRPAPTPGPPKRGALPGAGTTGPAARAAPGPPPAVSALSRLPAGPAKNDPRFRQALERLDASAAHSRHHPPANQKREEAEIAARPEQKEQQESTARRNRVGVMNTTPARMDRKEQGLVDKAAAVLGRTMPQTADQSASYMEHGGNDRRQVMQTITEGIHEQKSQATEPLAIASDKQSLPREVAAAGFEPRKDLPPEAAPAPPPGINASQAMPLPKPDADSSLEQGKRDTSRLLRDKRLTPAQLQKANDPRFSAVLTSKAEADRYADTTPGVFRAEERTTIASAVAQSSTDEKQALGVFHGQKLSAGHNVFKGQQSARDKAAAQQKDVIDHIQAIYTSTARTVETTLGDLERDATDMFDHGTDVAIQEMKSYLDVRFEDRYGGWFGWLDRAGDWAFGLPPFAEHWFVEAKALLDRLLADLLKRVQELVNSRLELAKATIALGELTIRVYVAGLKPNLRSVGETAEKDIRDRFIDLRHTVDDKKIALTESLNQRYKDAQEKGDKALQEIKDKHKGLTERFAEFVEEVADILANFADRILSMIKKAASVIWEIVQDPGGFLDNLLAAIGKGFQQFFGHIETHLKDALFRFLFGSLAASGLDLKLDFSPGGILKMILTVLGLTYDRLRERAIHAAGEGNARLVERVIDVLKTLWDGGPAALWEQAREFVTGLPDMVIRSIRSWLISSIIDAGIKKVLTLFLPAGGIIAAIRMIYDVVTFLIDHLDDIVKFVEAVFDSIADIVHGRIDGAAKRIEDGLVLMLDMLIAFLAHYAHVTGVTQEIKRIIHTVQDRVWQAVNLLISKLITVARSLLSGGRAPSTVAAQPGAPAGATAAHSANVRAEAMAALQAELSSDHTHKQAEIIVAQILTRLQPAGLKGLEVSKPDDDEVSVISAAASDLLPLLDLVPRGTIPKGRSVRMVAKLTLSEAFDVESRKLPAVSPSATVRAGGAIFRQREDKRASSSRAPSRSPYEVTVATWNTSNIYTVSNDSHAEHQFLWWLTTSMGDELMSRIEKVEINLSPFSPCSNCADNLIELLKSISKARGLPFVGRADARLTWTKAYPGMRGSGDTRTTPQDVRLMASAGWHLSAPSDAVPVALPDPALGADPNIHLIWRKHK